MKLFDNPVALIVLIIGIPLYFLPTWIALLRHHPNTLPIFLVNLFLGWTFLGWIGALVWSVWKTEKALPSEKPIFANDFKEGKMYCRNCGKEISAQAVFCPGCGVAPMNGKNFCQNCGQASNPLAEVCIKCGVRLSQGVPQPSTGEKSKIAAGLLGIFLGSLGIHRFYLGYVGIGIVQIIVTVITFGIGGLWGFIEGILILTGTFNKDSKGRPLKE